MIRIAIVHDWLIVYGGAERVLENLLDIYPQADVYSLIDKVPSSQRFFLKGKSVYTSILQKLPGISRYYRYLLPILPLVIEQFDLASYDLVISSSYCVAKGVLSSPKQVHICYCHSPVRYAWDQYHYYIKHFERAPLVSASMKLFFHYIRIWDVISSNSVDHFIATSAFVAARIAKFYRRRSTIIPPPVDLSLFSCVCEKKDHYVAVARFVPFKRLDIAVRAFAGMPDKELILLGDGPDMKFLKSLATPNIRFIGFQPPNIVYNYISTAKALIFPSEEDFGIVPLEAQASGTPVIAFGRGGAEDTVIPLSPSAILPTGVFFDEQTPASLVGAVHRFEDNIHLFDAHSISQHAHSFSPESFRRQLTELIDSIEPLLAKSNSRSASVIGSIS